MKYPILSNKMFPFKVDPLYSYDDDQMKITGIPGTHINGKDVKIRDAIEINGSIDNIINTIINSPNNSEEAPNKVDNFINYFNTPLSIPPYNPFKPISYMPNVIREQYKINDPIKDNVRDTVRQIITDKQNETIFNSSPSIIKPISEIISEIPVLKIPSDKLPIVGNNNGIFEEIDDIEFDTFDKEDKTKGLCVVTINCIFGKKLIKKGNTFFCKSTCK